MNKIELEINSHTGLLVISNNNNCVELVREDIEAILELYSNRITEYKSDQTRIYKLSSDTLIIVQNDEFSVVLDEDDKETFIGWTIFNKNKIPTYYEFSDEKFNCIKK